MPTQLEFALEQSNGEDFEKLAPGFLKQKGYEIKTSGVKGTDGGWDAFVEFGDRSGIAHASVRKDWRRKLRADARSSEELEDELESDFDVFIFITTREPTGQQELDLRTEIREEYGWELELLHRRDLILTLENDCPELAERYLDVDLGASHKHAEMERAIAWYQQVTARIDRIQRLAEKYESGVILSEEKIQRRMEPDVDALSQLANEVDRSGSTEEILEQVEQVVDIGDDALQVQVNFNIGSIQSQLHELDEMIDKLKDDMSDAIDRLTDGEQ